MEVGFEFTFVKIHIDEIGARVFHFGKLILFAFDVLKQFIVTNIS